MNCAFVIYELAQLRVMRNQKLYFFVSCHCHCTLNIVNGNHQVCFKPVKLLCLSTTIYC